MRPGDPKDSDTQIGPLNNDMQFGKVDHTMKVMRDETFGPLIPVMAFDDEGEAVELANDSDHGLGASVWTRDLRRGRMLADRIEAGMLWISDHAYSHGFPQTPWGGVKGSGSGGVTHSKFGLYEMVDKKLRGLVPDPWWYPYSGGRSGGFIRLMNSLYSEGRRARELWRNRRDIAGFLKQLLG